ncbi:CRISPR-associated protein Csx27 [Aquimarina hainanensis]|uniref:CRISPR-associated protein Csx27 n=1 Tax=Aquimarina hainanensis TaxID=1578017 RepID=A0ABW5NBU9_9FLAO
MNKLSLYSLLAILLPGVFAIFCLHYLNSYFSVFSLTFDISSFYEGTLLFGCALFAGLALYAISWRMPRFYTSIGLRAPISSIVASSQEIQRILPDLREHLPVIIKGASELTLDSTHKTWDAYFDEVYYILEAANQNSEVEGFHSFYLLCRQITALSVLASFGTIFLYFYSDDALFSKLLFLFLSISIIAYLITPYFRKRMVEKLFLHFNGYMKTQ